MNFKNLLILIFFFSCDFTTPVNNNLHDYNKEQAVVDFKTFEIKINYDLVDHGPYIHFKKDPTDYTIIMSENIINNSISVHNVTFESKTAVEIPHFTDLSFVFDYEFEVSETIHQGINFRNFKLFYRVLGKNEYNYINTNNLNQLLNEALPIHFRINIILSSGDISIINNPVNTAKLHINKLSILGKY